MTNKKKPPNLSAQSGEVRRLVRNGGRSFGLPNYAYTKRSKGYVKIRRATIVFTVLDPPDCWLRTFALICNGLVRPSVRCNLFNDFMCCIHANDYTQMNSIVNAQMDRRLHNELRI